MPRDTRKALIVGIDHYDQIQSLSGAVNDAYTVKAALERHADGTLNFPQPRLMTATGPGAAVSRTDLREAVQELFKDDAEISLLYFSGHGYIDGAGGYLCASDCASGHDGLSLNEVMAFAKQYPQVFDCYADLDKKDKNPYIFNPMTGNVRAFCSPRSLVKASNIVKQRSVLGSALIPALAGTVGESAARDMEALVNLADQLPLFENIVKAPTKAKVPDSVGALFILSFMLAGRVDASNLDAVMDYAERMSAVSFEAHALFITSLASNKSKVGMACMNRKFTSAAAKLGKYF